LALLAVHLLLSDQTTKEAIYDWIEIGTPEKIGDASAQV